MAAPPIQIWLETLHHAAFQVGGWAFVRADGAAAAGWAGGARRTDAERTALAGLAAALEGTAGGRGVCLRTASPLVAAIPARIAAAQAGEAAPGENLDLWAKAMTALAAGPVRIVRAPAEPGSPTAFAAAWAAFALDKAKTGGPFTSAIPKPNLIKAGL